MPLYNQNISSSFSFAWLLFEGLNAFANKTVEHHDSILGKSANSTVTHVECWDDSCSTLLISLGRKLLFIDQSGRIDSLYTANVQISSWDFVRISHDIVDFAVDSAKHVYVAYNHIKCVEILTVSQRSVSHIETVGKCEAVSYKIRYNPSIRRKQDTNLRPQSFTAARFGLISAIDIDESRGKRLFVADDVSIKLVDLDRRVVMALQQTSSRDIQVFGQLIYHNTDSDIVLSVLDDNDGTVSRFLDVVSYDFTHHNMSRWSRFSVLTPSVLLVNTISDVIIWDLREDDYRSMCDVAAVDQGCELAASYGLDVINDFIFVGDEWQRGAGLRFTQIKGEERQLQ